MDLSILEQQLNQLATSQKQIRADIASTEEALAEAKRENDNERRIRLLSLLVQQYAVLKEQYREGNILLETKRDLSASAAVVPTTNSKSN